MQTVLFHETVFGPIHSRRLGVSLGINLMPNDGKICSFDCVYCEAGFNAQGPGTTGVPSRKAVHNRLNAKLKAMKEAGDPLDVITFSGNGEPTLHPDFNGVVHDTLMLRDRYYPEAKVSVLSNSTMLHNPKVVTALKLVDNNILKLDSAINVTMRHIDQPKSPNFLVESLVRDLSQFSGQCIIQTLILRGSHDGKPFDNTTEAEITALISAYRTIAPKEVMIYTIDRATPEKNIEKIGREEMLAIGRRIEQEAGMKVQVNA